MPLSDLSISLSSSSSSSDEEPSSPHLIEDIPNPKTRVFKNRINPLELYDDYEFIERYRMSKALIMSLVDMIHSKLHPFTLRNKSISALEQVLLTIHFFATGGFQTAVADHVRVHKSTASRIIKKVSSTIAELKPQFISMPSTIKDFDQVKSEFLNRYSFPNIIGVVACKHIKIQSPGGSLAQLYKNREGYYSLKLQFICDAKLKIMDVNCQWPGSAHNTTIFNDSQVRADFESGVYGTGCLLGDSEYPCRPYLLTPVLHSSTTSEESYNFAHVRTRNTVENCFVALKTRFPCLSVGLRVKLETSMNIVVACCILHNMALNDNDPTDVSDKILNIPEDTGMSPITNENTSVRSSLLLTHFNSN